MDFLTTILKTKGEEIAAAQQRRPLPALMEAAKAVPEPRDFLEALENTNFALIAEIKKASPSRGVLCEDFDHRQLARDYEEGGAQALSVLTDTKFFQGDQDFVQQVKDVTSLPVLRKDFIIDEYQVYESRAIGADALLLIVRALNEQVFRRLYGLTRELGMAALVEVHDARDLELANRLKVDLIGINNRNLADFKVNLENSLMLRPKIWDGALSVSESGIVSRRDVGVLRKAGFDAVLVGEGILVGNDRAGTLRDFMAI